MRNVLIPQQVKRWNMNMLRIRFFKDSIAERGMGLYTTVCTERINLETV